MPLANTWISSDYLVDRADGCIEAMKLRCCNVCICQRCDVMICVINNNEVDFITIKKHQCVVAELVA